MRTIRHSVRRTTAILATVGIAACGTLAAVTAHAATPAARSTSTLSASAITATLARDAGIPGTAWVTDASGRIIVSYDRSLCGLR